MTKDGPFFLEIFLGSSKNRGRAGYDELYQEGELSQIPSFYLWLMDRLRLPAKGRLLDVSCGAGELVKLAARNGLRAGGIDISETVMQATKRHLEYDGFIAVSAGEALPFAAGSFDFVTCIGSLEHFADPAQGVREMTRVLRAGGKAFVLVPNTFSLMTNIWVAFRTGQTSVDSQPIQRYGARQDWIRLLETNGLQVQRTMKYERPWPRVSADWSYYLRRPKELIRLIVTPLVPLNLAFCFLFFCKK
jgi:2-polyprenyl-3-methyl-5-hydroxy-6-metoxy-1,4-benzoquinol methylase